MSETRHTPTPWELSDVREFGGRKVIRWTTEPNGHQWRRTVCEMRDGNMDEGEGAANAEFIVRAVNSHQALVEALKAARQFLSPDVQRGPASNGWQNTVELVEAALQHAEAR